MSLLYPQYSSPSFPLSSLCVFVKPPYDVDESIGFRIDFDDWMAVVGVTEGSEMTEVHRVRIRIFYMFYVRSRRPLLRPRLVAVADATWKNKKLHTCGKKY